MPEHSIVALGVGWGVISVCWGGLPDYDTENLTVDYIR
jgi:hypothetical protein